MKRAFIACAVVLTTSFLTLSSSFSDAGQVVYRWKDAQGNQVNSDRPPPQGTDYEVISTNSSMVRPVDAEEGAVPMSETQCGQQFQPVDSATPKIEKNPEYCKRAKDNLAALDMNVRIQMRNEQGEIHYLTKEEREVQRQKALDTIKANCD
ncbi:MAG: DUF4124 domain-containing protein [Halioglobus sp.]